MHIVTSVPPYNTNIFSFLYCTRKCLDSTIRSATMDEDGEISDKIRKPTSRHGSVDLPVSRDRLHRLQRELDNERHKNEVLYQAFLPKDVVDHLQRGQVPQGGVSSWFYNVFAIAVRLVLA